MKIGKLLGWVLVSVVLLKTQASPLFDFFADDSSSSSTEERDSSEDYDYTQESYHYYEDDGRTPLRHRHRHGQEPRESRDSRTPTSSTSSSSDDSSSDDAPFDPHRFAAGDDPIRSQRSSSSEGGVPYWNSRGHTHTRVQMGHRRQNRNKRPRGHHLWLPDNIDVEDWRQYHGMARREFQKTSDRIKQILALAEQDSGIETSSASGSSQGTGNTLNIAEGTIDGCIWLTYKQADEIYRVLQTDHRMRGIPTSSRRFKRKIIDLVQNPWNKWDISQPIVYKFDGKHNDAQKTIIRNAIAHWEENTCIRFQEASMEQVITQNHIVFTKAGLCQSYVGKVSINPQPISLDDACLNEFGVPVHEIGHALGFWHEQQRVDRGDHINIRWENLGRYRSQYYTSDTVSHGVPYDTSSVMHYATYDGSVNADKVIETIDPLFQQTLGQRVGLSFFDKKLANHAYCSDTCEHIKLKRSCQHGGFQDPNNCHGCVCPDGIGGRFCEDVAPAKNAVCGGEVYATPDTQHISSPGFDTVEHYESQQECSWLIKAPANQKVSLEFVDDFGLYFHHAETCFHWVEIKYKGDFSKNGPRFCGNRERPSVVLQSTGNEMLVIFKSNFTLALTNYMRGFKAKILAVTEDGGVPNPTPAPTTTTPPTTAPPTTTTTTAAPWHWSCNFDTSSSSSTSVYQYDWCGIQQDIASDQFDWTLKSGKTPSYNTGPTWAFDGRYYIYIEASSPRKYNDKAIVRLPDFKRSGVHCLTFKYYMWGFHVNELNVFQEPYTGDATTVWSVQGQQKDLWLSAEVQINLKRGDRIGFTGIRGKEFSGDIAMDNIEITSGRC